MSTSSATKAATAKGEQSRQRIIDAALEAFREKGYQETTIQDICDLSKTTVGSFYHYFSSKQDLVWAMNDEINAKLNNFYSGLKITSYSQAILKVIEFQTMRYETYGPELISFMYKGVLFSQNNNFDLNKYALYHVLCDALMKGQNEKQFSKEYSIEFLAETVLSLFMLCGILWCNHHDALSLKEISHQKIETFLKSISSAGGV